MYSLFVVGKYIVGQIKRRTPHLSFNRQVVQKMEIVIQVEIIFLNFMLKEIS